MDVAETTLGAYLDEWLALLRMRIQPTTLRGYDDMIHAYLRWQDVDLTVPQLRVITSLTYVDGHYQLKSTKTGRGRVLTLDEDTAVAIARQPHPARDEWPLVFTRPSGMPLRPRFITDR